MNEPEPPPAPEASAPPPVAPAPKVRPTWRRALGLVWSNPRDTMLPLAVIQLPLSTALAVVYFYLYYKAYPDADFESFNRFDGAPSTLVLLLVILTGVYLLYTLVGGAATIVAVKHLLEGKPAKLTEALDPAFTRMGGLLAVGVLFYVMVVATGVGIIVFVYLIIRWGLAVHALVLDGTSIGGALGSSWRLLRGRMLRFTGIVLTAIPFGLALLIGASIIFAIATAPFGTDPGRTVTLLSQSLGIIVSGIVAIPTGAYLASATTMFYVSAKEQTRA